MCRAAVGRSALWGLVMPLCRNKSYLVTTISIATFASIITFSYLTKRNASAPKEMHCGGTPASDTITPLKDNKTLIINAYYDNRESGVEMTRVIGIVHHKDVKELYCWFCCSSVNQINISQAKIDVHSDRFGFPYGATDLQCLEPKDCEPHYIMIHWSRGGNIDQLPRFEIRNRHAKDYALEFTVCISTMFGNYNNVLQFVQSMEMYKILGVDKVVIYKNTCSQLMAKVLDFYVAEGIVEIIPWPIDSYLSTSSYWHHSMDAKDIGYYGQITALNDCIYRNMYKTKYVLLNDIDEIILPVKYPDWKTMMHSLQMENPGSAVFLFENYNFPQTIFEPNNPFNISLWGSVPGVNILQHIMREPDRKHVPNPRKMIVDPRKVIQTSVHDALKAYGRKVYVPMDVAFAYHCRFPFQEKLPRKYLTKDTIIWKFNESLVGSVTEVLQQTVL